MTTEEPPFIEEYKDNEVVEKAEIDWLKIAKAFGITTFIIIIGSIAVVYGIKIFSALGKII